MRSKKLPEKLKQLVNSTISLLGEVIKEQAGNDFYLRVEKIRAMMIKYRKQNDKGRYKALLELYKIIDKLSPKRKIQLSQAFTLYLEVVNSCETAYRTWRLRQKEQEETIKDVNLFYVITAHPTESRGVGNIQLFQKIQRLCISHLKQKNRKTEEKIKHLLKLCWASSLTKHQRPTIEDEADHLFSIVLRKEILEKFIAANDLFSAARLRTWVGGDKDGHPGVDEKALLSSLKLSRKKIYGIVRDYLLQVKEMVNILKSPLLTRQFLKTEKTFKTLKNLNKKDALKTESFSGQMDRLGETYQKHVGQSNPEINAIKKILRIFPGLVLPLELREDSSEIRKAVENNTKKLFPIEKMLLKLTEIAGREKIRNYARGFVISMTMSSEDMLFAARLVKKHLNQLYLPVIPLFETKDALDKSEHIIRELLGHSMFKQALKNHWHKRLEIMLGYSDS
ncbi:MAG: phosphoenolpyruvate carboxylase, partial [Halobacteriovoraceae bacterium]|nr:phosphoenolpyruvate carboxylase [Halobacteriovoraceae bacterium]